MFHMLGRFAFTSFFSRRSIFGSSKGLNGFGFCFCENGPLSIFVISYQSIHYSQFEATKLAARSPPRTPIRVPFPSDVPATPHMGPSSPNDTLSGRGDVGRLPPSVTSRLLAGFASLVHGGLKA